MKDNLVAWLISPVLMLLGLAIYLSPRLDSVPLPAPTLVEASQINPAPLRKPLRPPLAIRVAGYRKDCMDCHALFKSRTNTPFAMFQHQEIQQAMAHGTNTRCYNCHDLEARDQLVLDDGTLIGFDKVELVCAKCHGPTYRDWLRGAHGKTMGYWNTSLGESNRLTCIQCHDPHAPAFDKFRPLPGPRTLRMNAIPRAPDSEHVAGKTNPLRTWSTPHAPHVERSHRLSGTAESDAVKREALESGGTESGGRSQEMSHE